MYRSPEASSIDTKEDFDLQIPQASQRSRVPSQKATQSQLQFLPKRLWKGKKRVLLISISSQSSGSVNSGIDN